MNYYDWMESTHTCRACGWHGKGSDAELLESFRDGSEYCCPKCNEKLAFVAYPTISEALTDPRANAADRKVAEVRAARNILHSATKLQSIDQLPDLQPIPESFEWDIDSSGANGCVVVRTGDTEVWRELSFYENYRRFGEIASLLWRKYGSAIKDLIPSYASETDLYGDAIASLEYVKRVRLALSRGKDPLSE